MKKQPVSRTKTKRWLQTEMSCGEKWGVTSDDASERLKWRSNIEYHTGAGRVHGGWSNGGWSNGDDARPLSKDGWSRHIFLTLFKPQICILIFKSMGLLFQYKLKETYQICLPLHPPNWPCKLPEPSTLPFCSLGVKKKINILLDSNIRNHSRTETLSYCSAWNNKHL